MLKLATTKNTQAFVKGMETVCRPIRGQVRMGAFFGPPGTGKTEAAADYCLRNNAIYIRATSVDSPASFLRELCKELGEEPSSRIARRLLDQAVVKLAETRQTVVVDEADYLTHFRARFIELLRDLNDIANVPVVMIGMEHLDKKLSPFKHLWDRVRVKVKFELFNEGDIAQLAGEMCGAVLDASAIHFIAERSGGKLRLITELFDTAQTLAERNKLKAVGAAHLQPKAMRAKS